MTISIWLLCLSGLLLMYFLGYYNGYEHSNDATENEDVKDIELLKEIRQEIKDIEDFEIVYGCLYVRYYDIDKIIDKYIKKSEDKE